MNTCRYILLQKNQLKMKINHGQKDKRDMDKHNSQILITENCRLLHIKFLTSRSSTICAPPSLSCKHTYKHRNTCKTYYITTV